MREAGPSFFVVMVHHCVAAARCASEFCIHATVDLFTTLIGMVHFSGEHSKTALSQHGAQKMCQLHNACVVLHVACALGQKSCCVSD